MAKMADVLLDLDHCPHCSVSRPAMTLVDLQSEKKVARPDGGWTQWNLYKCENCYRIVLAESYPNMGGDGAVLRTYPAARELDPDLPERVSNYLKQAIASLHAPDGAAMLAGASVDAMLKDKGLRDGSVYKRINEAVANGLLTADMGEWAHDVRLGSNRPRHADEDDLYVSEEEARQAVEFAEMLGHFLFVLPRRVTKKAAAAKQLSNGTPQPPG